MEKMNETENDVMTGQCLEWKKMKEVWMPWEILIRKDLSFLAKTLLSVYIQYWSLGEHVCILTNETLGKLFHKSERTIQYAKAELTKAGLIDVKGVSVTPAKEYEDYLCSLIPTDEEQ